MNNAIKTASIFAAAIALTACTATPTVTETATITATPVPERTVTEAPNSFEYYMLNFGVSDFYLNDPSMMQSMDDLGRSTCDLLDAGFTTDEIIALAAAELGDADYSLIEVTTYSMLAGTYAYCPEYKYEW